MLITGKIATKVGCDIATKCDRAFEYVFNERLRCIVRSVQYPQGELLSRVAHLGSGEVAGTVNPIINHNIISIEDHLHAR